MPYSSPTGARNQSAGITLPVGWFVLSGGRLGLDMGIGAVRPGSHTRNLAHISATTGSRSTGARRDTRTTWAPAPGAPGRSADLEAVTCGNAPKGVTSRGLAHRLGGLFAKNPPARQGAGGRGFRGFFGADFYFLKSPQTFFVCPSARFARRPAAI